MSTALKTCDAPLSVVTETVGETSVIRFKSSRILGDDNAREMGDGLNAAFDVSGPGYRFVIDLAGVQLLSSAAIAKLIVFRRRVKERGGELMLCRLYPQVSRAFRLTNLSDYFSIHPDLDTALTSFE